jgi:enoyl-CoA hydratase/carnithine racemase
MDEHILLTAEGGVATVTFNRPGQRNAVDYEGWLRLIRIADELKGDPSVKVVVFRGAGDAAFSAGADIKDFERYRNNSSDAKIYADAFDGALDAVEALPKPTISMIRGFCVGGGCEFAMATDIRIADETGRFGIPVARLGILVGYREMRRLVHLVGPGNASDILMTARLLDAQEAFRMGLVSRLVSSEEIEEVTHELANEMVPLAPLTQSRHKRILQTVLRNPSLNRLTPEEEHLPFANFDSEDFQEGRRAFLERRKPIFKGK